MRIGLGRSAFRDAVVALGAAAILAGCSSNRPPDQVCAMPAITIELEVSATALTQPDPAVCRGQQVTLDLLPSFDGVVHLHGYEVAREVQVDERVRLEFIADRSGQFVIEAHPNGSQNTTIGILTVHEP